ncbi:APC family permease [Pseudomonas putida]|uniref:APC family permease n=1 Tax=Pseudomonas putida TaxID=303 RepID=UPI0002D745B1|nr:APC family permease [Pseudomonas putida]
MEQSALQGQLRPGSLGTADIVFFVIAAAAPLGATLGAGPVVFAMGGAISPAIYLAASVVLLLFAIGFAAMSRHVVSAGGFADLVRSGLGKTAGHAAAGVALLAYICMLAGLYGQFAAFGADILSTLAGLTLDWKIIAVLGMVLIGVFGYLDVNVSAKVLGILMVLEVLIMVLFDIAVLFQTDLSTFDWGVLSPLQLSISTPGVSLALMFAFCCFVGFESTTIYGEEARNPNRTVPLATYIAIILIGVFYTLTSVSLALAYADVDVKAAASGDMLNFVFNANTKFVGNWSTATMKVLVVTSVFAVLLSFHNALCRYLFSLARSGFLARALSQVHPKHASPHRASLTLSLCTLVLVGGFMVAGADPVQQLYLWLVGLGTLGVLILQALGAAAVVGFSLKTGKCGVWQGVVAPVLGGAGLLCIVVLAITHFSELSGASDGAATNLPWLLLLAALLGALNGRFQRPSIATPSSASVSSQ